MKKTIKYLTGVAVLTAFITTGAQAEMTEKEILKKCEMSVCELIVKKNADGGNISCDLVKTWGKKELEKGASHGKLKWSWGDARCTTKLDLARDTLLKALSEDKYDLKVKATPVTCNIGGDEKSEISFTLAPTLGFEKGQVKTASIGIDNIKGPFFKRMALKTAQLVDKSSMLHGVIAKEINKFITEKCPEKIK